MPDEDVITVWMATHCEVDIGSWVGMDELYASYEAIAKLWKEPTFTRRQFADIIDRDGFYKQRRDGVNGFRGLRLRSDLKRRGGSQ